MYISVLINKTHEALISLVHSKIQNINDNSDKTTFVHESQFTMNARHTQVPISYQKI